MKIFVKLLLVFLSLSVIPLIIFFGIVNHNFYNYFLEEQELILEGIADEKIQDISNLFKTLRNEAQLIASSDTVIGYLTKPESKVIRKEEKLFDIFSGFYQLNNIYLVNPTGKIVFAMEELGLDKDLNTGFYKQPPTHALIESVDELSDNLKVFQGFSEENELSKVFNNTKILLEPTLSNFSYFSPSRQPVVFMGVPVFYEQKFIGVLILELPDEVIYSIFRNYSSLGKTGEMLVAKQVGQKLLYLNPIRHQPDAAFNLEIEMGSDQALPMQAAVQGVKGRGVSIDYRGEKVLAIWNYFPYLQLGIVVKIDFDEIFGPLYHIRNLVLIFGSITFVFVLGIIVYISKTISRPIQKLQEGVKIVGSGNLDYKVSNNKHDEIGDLSRAFDQMVEHLKESTTSIERLNEEVEQRKSAEEVKAGFFSMVAHELRGPIAPIRDGITLILDGEAGEINAEQKRFLGISLQNTNRLLVVINDILDFQGIESGKLKYNISDNDINSVLLTTVEMYQQMIRKKKLQLDLDLAENLPAAPFDKNRIIQVIGNLLSNAIKFTEQGRLSIKSSLQGQNLQIEISDSGEGIAKEDIAKLFQTFVRLNVKVHGTGLGLTICKKIIEDHRGEIWVESIEGEGSSFFFTLPVE